MNEYRDVDTGYYCQQRLSFDGHLCTVRYIGQVQETKGLWLGVEWDDTSRGKHSGVHQGVRYFNCTSKHPNAASFVRPTRPHDTPLSFLEALHQKYAPDVSTHQIIDKTRGDKHALSKPIEIGGKAVEEVGFEKISQQLAMLTELRIVLLDGRCVAGVLSTVRGGGGNGWFRKLHEIGQTCPKVSELDLSRSLLERWQDVEGICNALKALKTLKLNGNRFNQLVCNSRLCGQDRPSDSTFDRIKELGLDETLLTWEEIDSVASRFQSLATLSLSSNGLASLGTHQIPRTITTLKLEFNGFTSISALLALASLPNLQQLYLGHNSIADIQDKKERIQYSDVKFPRSLFHVDLSFNAIHSWECVDGLQDAFPGLTALRIEHNQLFDLEFLGKKQSQGPEERHMLVVARLANLKTLNFSSVTPQERANAELYYLSCIAKELAAESEEKEGTIFDKHRRYNELCEIYGTPTITRTNPSIINPNSLEARLIRFTFYQPIISADGTSLPNIVHKKQIPRGFDVYRLKGIVGKLFERSPLRLRLIWETGEWDPVAPIEHEDWYSSDEEDKVVSADEQGNWVKREVELRDGTREVGYWVEAQEATVRIELI
ncbi:MAG: hypothetical protein M1835_006543 [Candelina submexicana]|nr:MAG: hypothetical protein M1835_006543 [Candelina submexicana]